jgi:hypothetical protein
MNKNTSGTINKRLKALEAQAQSQSGFCGNIFFVGAISDLEKLDANVFHPHSLILYEDNHLSKETKAELDVAFKRKVEELKELCGIYGEVRYHLSEASEDKI